MTLDMKALLIEAKRWHFQETLDKKFQWKWENFFHPEQIAKSKSPARSQATFRTAGGREYHVQVKGQPVAGGYQATIDFFDGAGKVSVTGFGAGEQFRILATVFDICKDYVKTVNPDIVLFSAVKVGGGNQTRDRIYKRMVQRAFKDLKGYNLKTLVTNISSNQKVEFILKRGGTQ